MPISKLTANPRHTAEMRRRAVGHHLEHGKSPARTMRALGYPKGREALGDWTDEIAPGRRKYGGPDPRRGPAPAERRVRVVAEPGARTGPAAQVAERHGASRAAPCAWRREMTGDDGGEPETRGEPVSRERDDPPGDVEVLRDMPREARTRLRRVRLELDVRQATLEMVKKTRAPNRARRPTRRRRRW